MLLETCGTIELHDDGEINQERNLRILRIFCPVCCCEEKAVAHVMMAFWSTVRLNNGDHRACKEMIDRADGEHPYWVLHYECGHMGATFEDVGLLSDRHCTTCDADRQVIRAHLNDDANCSHCGKMVH